MFLERLHRLQTLLGQFGLDGVAAIAGPNLFYLTGLSFHLSERPAVGFFPALGQPVLVVPELEVTKVAAAEPYPVRVFSYDDRRGPAAAFEQAARALSAERLGVEHGRMRVMELRWIEAAFTATRIEPAEDVFARLRLVKDETELRSMRRAVLIAEQAFAALLPQVRPEVSEAALAAELVSQMLRLGSEAELPFAPIVAAGPNSALPHAAVTQRHLQPGDLLIVDWGASWQGYASDLTRTLGVGPVDQEWQTVFAAVKTANLAATAQARPGVTCASVDAAARGVIVEAGYGEYFTHRLGHGLGLEGHEAPSVHGDNPLVLEPGVVFTVEPGIYLPGRGGVRIEDDVVVTAEGCESLSSYPRDWLQV